MIDGDAGGLSRVAQACWGKYSKADEDWMPLHRHLTDTAGVAGRLWDEWLPEHVRSVIAGHLDDGQARILVSWLAGVHDLGKASPAFAGQVPTMRDHMQSNGFRFTGTDRERSPHSIQSHLIVRDWLVDRGFAAQAAAALACVPGGHHGIAPHVSMIRGGDDRVYRGADRWRDVQRELADWIAIRTGIDVLIPLLAARPPLPQAQVMLTAVVVIADWIASDAGRFPFRDAGSSADRAERAWSTLQLPPPWRANPDADDDRLFTGRFDLATGATMRPVQRTVAAAARAADDAQLYIVEAPMGEGKTEAALLAAEIQAQRHGLGGCFIALPTMATSDAMFRRVNDWVTRLGAQRTSIFLAHGKAALNDDFQGLVRLGRLTSVGEQGGGEIADDCGADVAIAHEWLSGRKKGVLANFVVGTIDQILFSALRSRHLVLRHLAVVGKVVVIDEVHSSDDYMAVFLAQALYWLAAYRVPTVLLSATLSDARRRQLIAAYDRGLRAANGPPNSQGSGRRIRKVGPTEPDRSPAAENQPVLDYPMLTTVGSTGVTTTPVKASGRALSVQLETMPDDPASLVGLLGPALAQGGVVAVVRNTVRRAQETAGLLRQAFPGVDVVLAHSRFLAADRAARERDLRNRLGPPPDAVRPPRMIVVGTQVLEQSLDVDFDLLVTDLAPADLILQRIGRLHRHVRPSDVRGVMTQPRCVLVGAEDWVATPPRFDPGSEAVYGRAALLRSAAVLLPRATTDGTIELPADIPIVVHQASSPGIEIQDSWRADFDVAEVKATREHDARVAGAKTYVLDDLPRTNLVNWATLGDRDAEAPKGRARVRDSEDGIEVLVAQCIDGRPRLLPWIDRLGDREFSWDAEPDRDIAKALAGCSLRLPRQLTHPRIADDVIGELEVDGRVAWQQSKWLRGELFLFLDGDLTATLAGHLLRYSRDDGLEVEAVDG